MIKEVKQCSEAPILFHTNSCHHISQCNCNALFSNKLMLMIDDDFEQLVEFISIWVQHFCKGLNQCNVRSDWQLLNLYLIFLYLISLLNIVTMTMLVHAAYQSAKTRSIAHCIWQAGCQKLEMLKGKYTKLELLSAMERQGILRSTQLHV